jgi:L-fuconate dehydratase
MTTIQKVTTHDVRFPLAEGEGADAVHQTGCYAYGVTAVHGDDGRIGVGGALTLGAGNDVVCQLARELAPALVGRDLETMMSAWGERSRQLADDASYRWLGPHKGAVHLALASITNACFDLWAKHHRLPLWKLLLSLSPEQIVALLDLSYIEDVVDPAAARTLLEGAAASRTRRTGVIEAGYPGYDTSVGWFNFADEVLQTNARRAAEAGFTAMKLKVGSDSLERDLRRVQRVRDAVGDRVTLMVDANQQWRWPQAMEACQALAAMNLYWIEEPTHPDDLHGHRRLAEAVDPVRIAAGEHVPNRVVFKNLMQAGALHIVQPDALRLAGVSEFLAVSLLAKQFNLPVVPHVGDMGQLHQHLVLFNHIALDMDKIFLEYIPHLHDRFAHPAQVAGGVYQTPHAPGAGFDFVNALPFNTAGATSSRAP